MATNYLGGALMMGPQSLQGSDAGWVVLTDTTTVTTAADGSATSATILLPASSQILNLFLDTVVAKVVGGGTATTIPATVGTAAAGTQYLSSTDLFAGGRASLSFTAAQLTSMADIGANTSVVVTLDPNGTISTTQQVVRFTVVYAQKV
jgi:hypothetical protein